MSSTILVYGFMGMLDAETGDGNDTHVVLRCDGFINPTTRYDKEYFSFKLQTNRYTYKGGPKTILETATISNIDVDMRSNNVPDPDPEPTYVETIVSASCGFTNEYNNYFATRTIGSSTYTAVPAGLVAYVTLTIETKE
jgi:hypothetical protein